MQDQTTCAPACALVEKTEQHLLWLLLRHDRRGPWHAQELAREVGDPEQAGVALAGLHAAGLAHLNGEFAHATYAAERFYALTVPMYE
ncbi:MAG TPA: hypothetical protein VNV42_04430 [Solirubrobacteraceae bacterium]|jgi:hypothetical protein|nr:hypothetical protein [Solirubrobacteraceae bacterium]